MVNGKLFNALKTVLIIFETLKGSDIEGIILSKGTTPSESDIFHFFCYKHRMPSASTVLLIHNSR